MGKKKNQCSEFRFNIFNNRQYQREYERDITIQGRKTKQKSVFFFLITLLKVNSFFSWLLKRQEN